MRAILADDERMTLEELGFILKTNEGVEIVGQFTDPVEALEEIIRAKPDVVFLDIEMPEMNGFAVAEEIIRLGIPVCIVFVTAYNDFAVKAFEINAIDYVLKPFSEERLSITVKRLKQRMDGEQKKNEKYMDVIRKQAVKPDNGKIHVWNNEKIIFLKISEILYCTVEDEEVTIITQAKRYKNRGKLSELEEKLENSNFFRCHKSFLISLDKVEEVSPFFNNSYIIKLKGATEEIPLSRNYAKDFKQRMGIL